MSQESKTAEATQTVESQNAQSAQGANSGIRKESVRKPLEVTRVYEANYQKEGTVTAEMKQTIETKSFYPSKSVTSNMQANPFSNEEFGFSEQPFESNDTRVAWLDVPKGTTAEQVIEKMKSFPKAQIYKVLANRPIVTNNQQYAIDNNITTLDIIAAAQVIRYPKNHETMAGKIILDPNGKVQYRQTFLWLEEKADEDKRNADVNDYYASPEVMTEITGALSAEQAAIVI